MFYICFWARLCIDSVFCIFFLLRQVAGMWDLSPLTTDQTLTPALEAWSFNHWTARGVTVYVILSKDKTI